MFKIKFLSINASYQFYCQNRTKLKKMPESHFNATQALTNLLSLGD